MRTFLGRKVLISKFCNKRLAVSYLQCKFINNPVFPRGIVVLGEVDMETKLGRVFIEFSSEKIHNFLYSFFRLKKGGFDSIQRRTIKAQCMTTHLHLIANSLRAGSCQRRHMVQVEIKLHHRRYVTLISRGKISERGLRFLLLLMAPNKETRKGNKSTVHCRPT